MTTTQTPFRFSPGTLMSLEIEARTGTTRMPIEYEPLPTNGRPTPGEMIIELACQRCQGLLYDGALMAQIRKMTMQDVLLAAHGYLDGELQTTDAKS